MSAPLPFEFLADDALRAAKSNDGTGIVPAGLLTKAELFDALAEVLQAPDWFGRNFDALYDLLRDPFIGGRELHRLIHEDLPLEDALEQTLYLETLADAVADQKAAGERTLIVNFPASLRREVQAKLRMA